LNFWDGLALAAAFPESLADFGRIRVCGGLLRAFAGCGRRMRLCRTLLASPGARQTLMRLDAVVVLSSPPTASAAERAPPQDVAITPAAARARSPAPIAAVTTSG
jgi:hypothetical protein